MPREVELKLKELLAKKGIKQAELADRVGVSKGTIALYCKNRWTVLDRTVLERTADVLDCDAASLLITTDSHFFDPYRDHSGEPPKCVFLKRPDAEKLESGRRVGHRDNLAIGRVARLLEDAVEGMVAIEDSAMTLEAFDRHLRDNCVVLGSPMVNGASEMAICRAFGVAPFEAGKAGRLPFHFRVVARPEKFPSSLIRASLNDQPGIWLRDEKELLPAETWPREEFRHRDIRKGRDYAVVLVWHYKTPDSALVRKLIVLAGFGGVGTEGAAMALVDHFRDLEPGGKEQVVWGAIEVSYRKLRNSTTRDILNYNWRYRKVGRCPVPFGSRKLPV